MNATRHEARLGDLARDRCILPVELDFGHPLFDFDQPFVHRLALSRCSYTIRVDAQDSRMRNHPHAQRVQWAIKAAVSAPLEAKITDLASVASSSLDTWTSQPLSSQPTIELTASEITVAIMWFTPLSLIVMWSTCFVSRSRGHLLTRQSHEDDTRED